MKEIEEMREVWELRGEDIIAKEKGTQEKEKWEKIRGSRSNKWYNRVKGKGVPDYLKKEWKEKRWQRIVRFRLGNRMRGNKYWEKEERRKYKVCEWGKETWEHV